MWFLIFGVGALAWYEWHKKQAVPALKIPVGMTQAPPAPVASDASAPQAPPAPEPQPADSGSGGSGGSGGGYAPVDSSSLVTPTPTAQAPVKNDLATRKTAFQAIAKDLHTVDPSMFAAPVAAPVAPTPAPLQPAPIVAPLGVLRVPLIKKVL